MKKMFMSAALAGLLALAAAACGGSESGGAQPAEVQIVLNEFRTESSLASFEKGKAYRFNIENQGKLAHEWSLTPRGSVEHTEMLQGVGAELLPPGARITVEYAFPSNIPGPLEFACHIAGHYEAGMHTDIEVK